MILRSLTSTFLLTATAIVVSSCGDKELENRIETLENELKEVRSSLDVELTDSVEDLLRRIELAEQRTVDTDTFETKQEDRFQRIEKSISEAAWAQEQGAKTVYLQTDSVKNTILRSEVGSFLVRLESIEKDPVNGSLTARINIGNPFNIALHEFTVKGDHGKPVPTLLPGENYPEYSKRLDTWQRGLTPFEEDFTLEVAPNAWTQIELPLPPSGEGEPDMVRFALGIKQARLVVGNGANPGDKLSIFRLDLKQAAVLKTEYGGFLIAEQQKPAREGDGTRVYVRIANPTGFSVGRCKLSGQFGPSPPPQDPGENADAYNQRIVSWKSELQDFEATVSGKLGPTRWNPANFLIPESDLSKVQFFRLQLIIENVSLP